ncbi:MAG: glycerol-3-phosphate 1-O-acyltransferase PlsY [Endomicrobium sp.]|jgi:glycerol-3-phosphate acyltransferase PlsY|uniref:glycerol-3-phosphate 1-O-acyltransferase PlsY n=1 Tax=Candidatus Endomicrobiellum cubanum TaxID=3242325 RepID=UPI0028300E6E|nr:glycerol-3-phosphate 1-O-acyltransferase PlsY [Endomicrobium sp.]
MLLAIIYIICAYLCGSINFAYIITKMVVNVDIRKVGSNNPGTTNVLRIAGTWPAIFTLILDAFKGFIVVFFAIYISDSFSYSVMVCFAVLLGHMFPIFFSFKGGKGVATGLGVFLALMPMPTVIAFSIFILVFLCFSYISLSSICAALSLPIGSYFCGYSLEAIIFSFAIAMLIIYKHKSNLKRLKEGKENKSVLFKRK